MAVNLTKLKAVLSHADYDSKTAAEVCVIGHAVNVDYPVLVVSGQAIFEAADRGERNALSADQKQIFFFIAGMAKVAVNGTNTKAELLDMFGAGTTTRPNLVKLQTTKRSRFDIEGLGGTREGDVVRARKP